VPRDELPVIRPTAADAGTLVATLMAPGDSFELNAHPPSDADLTL
jgi:hypothetical protein